MYDWKLTPEYINEHWTEELFMLMFHKRNSRMRIEAGVKPKSKVMLADTTFLHAAGVQIKGV